MPSYYHCAPLPLGPGSIICPGNWGRIKRQYEENALALLREVSFEAVRAAEFPTLPSRLTVAFVCTSEASAAVYRGKHARAGLLYEVELVDPSAPSHVADHELFVQGFVGIDGANDLARRYWRGESLGFPEMLTMSPLRILRCLDADFSRIVGLQPSP